jgi:hypothetical protein
LRCMPPGFGPRADAAAVDACPLEGEITLPAIRLTCFDTLPGPSREILGSARALNGSPWELPPAAHLSPSVRVVAHARSRVPHGTVRRLRAA